MPAPRAAAGTARVRVLAGIVGGVVTLALVGACTAGGSPDDQADAASPNASATAVPDDRSTPHVGPSHDAGDGPGTAAGSTPPTTSASDGGSGSSSGGTQAPGTSSETLPTPAPRATQPPPSPAPTGPSLTGALPASASARGEKLVAGFPTRVVPVLPELRVVSSSVAAQGDRLQIGLEASADVSPTAVLDAYVTALARSGFAASDSPAVPGSTATAFTRGSDGVTVTVRARLGGGTELVLAGTLSTAG